MANAFDELQDMIPPDLHGKFHLWKDRWTRIIAHTSSLDLMYLSLVKDREGLLAYEKARSGAAIGKKLVEEDGVIQLTVNSDGQTRTESRTMMVILSKPRWGK